MYFSSTRKRPEGKDLCLFSGVHFPYKHSIIAGGSSEIAPIGRPGDIEYRSAVPCFIISWEGEYRHAHRSLSCTRPGHLYVPDVYLPAARVSSCHVFPIGCPRYPGQRWIRTVS